MHVSRLGPGAVLICFLAAACGSEEQTVVPGRRSGVAPPSPSPAPQRVSPPEEWFSRSCVTCHGRRAEGSPLGPALAPVIPLYVASEGSREKAAARLVRYIQDPQGVPTLRDGPGFTLPMTVFRKLGGRPGEAERLAAFLLTLPE